MVQTHFYWALFSLISKSDPVKKIPSAFDVNSDKIQEIIVAPVEKKRKDLPSHKNLGDYVNSKGRMDMLQFFQDHKTYFPNLWTIVQREAARRTVEVGCEWFFGLSGMCQDQGELILV